MAKVEGISQVLSALRKRGQDAAKANVSVTVGFEVSYAIHVHENLEARHAVGQAKFLEQPARELAGELAKMVRDGLANGLTMAQSLLRAGLRLQREAQRLCPVDTGALRNSAFTRLEKGGAA